MAAILIVDDVPANRKVLATILGHHGHRVTEASDGREALAATRAATPDLVITDVLMPVMDGYEFVRQMRTDPATHVTPVLFYTATYGAREARARASAAGVSWVLTKPADASEVLDAVGRALAGDSDAHAPVVASTPAMVSDSEQLRLMADQLSEKTDDLKLANARLRAMVNIGLELASERDAGRLLERVSAAGRDLFGASDVTLGIVDLDNRTVSRCYSVGTDAADWIKPGDALMGILSTVVAERRTLRGGNPARDPSAAQFPALHPDVGAFLVAPVASPAHVYGWFGLVRNDALTFSEDDEQLVSALAGQVGRIYESLHVHAVTQRRTHALELELVARRDAESALPREPDSARR